MTIALILSGGTGTRLGADIPKQYIEVNGRTILSYCLETLFLHPEIDGVQIVAEPSWQQVILKDLKALEQLKIKDLKQLAQADRQQGTDSMGENNKIVQKFRGFSAPGATRQLSILNGLTDILKYDSSEDVVMIHDAARPCLSMEMISQGIAAVEGHDGVLPVLPMKDTVYLSEDGKAVSSLLNRSQVFAGQAPEFFVLGKYYEANQALLPEKILSINGSTEPAILAGLNVAMIPGDEGNFKITTKADLERFQQIVHELTKVEEL